MPTTITINPDAQGFYNTWNSGSTTYSKTTAVSDASDATYIAPTGFTFDSYTLSATGVSAQSVISSVVVHIRAQAASDGSYTILGRLNGTDQMGPVGSFTGGGATLQEVTYDLPRPGGGAWSVADVDALEAGIRVNWSIVIPAVMKIWATVTYAPAGVQLTPTRQTASRHVARYGSQPDTVELPLVPEFLRMSLLDDLPVFHSLIPTAGGTGSGIQPWERFLGRTVEKSVDLNNPAKMVTLRLEDLREFLHTYRDGGITPLQPNGLNDGVLILDPGATRTWDGPVVTLLSNQSALVVQVPEDVEPVNHQGRWHESAATNYVLDSSFLDATTSGTPWGVWTSTGAAAAIALNTAENIFDAAISTKHLAITPTTSGLGGTPGIAQAGTSAPADYLWFSIDHRESTSSGSLGLRIQRASDSKFWTLSAWTSISTINNLPVATTTATRFTNLIDQTTGATTYTITLYGQSTGVTHHIFHVQQEKLTHTNKGRGWPTSRIITGTTAVTRAASSLSMTNHSAARVLPATRGTYMVRFRTEWATTDVSTGTGTAYIWTNGHSTVDFRSLYYTFNTKLLTYQSVVAGTSYTVSSSAMTLASGATGCVAITWQSTDGENSNSSYTLTLTVDGLSQAKSTSAAFNEATSSMWYRGNYTDALGGPLNNWNGTLWDERVSPFVLTLPEIRRWMQRS